MCGLEKLKLMWAKKIIILFKPQTANFPHLFYILLRFMYSLFL